MTSARTLPADASCLRSIASGPTTAAASTRCTGARTAPTPPKPTRLRWDWQHRRNPYNRTGQPGIWVAREGPTVVGHYPTLPVRVSLKGLEVDGAWGADAMVAPERERQGLGEALLRAWDRNSGAVLALGVSPESRAAARPAALAASRTSLPCLVKPLTRRAVRLPHLPTPSTGCSRR